MTESTLLPKVSAARIDRQTSGEGRAFTRAALPVRAAARAAVFFLKVFPMLPSRPVDWVTPAPVIDRVKYPTSSGLAEGEVYRPAGDGPHPGIVVCLGVVPFGVDHPQVSVLGKALARAGFAVLLYWSPAMRDFRLVPEDIENIALAYRWFTEQPYIDPSRSGMIGTCVGASFALMASASPLIRDKVAFVGGYAPFSSMWTFARDIASATRSNDYGQEPWQVDQLTRKVFIHSFTSLLTPDEAEQVRNAVVNKPADFDEQILTSEGRAIYALLTAQDPAGANEVLHSLPAWMQERLTTLSPVKYLEDIHAPLISLLHDTGDMVIPVGETRRMVTALTGRSGVQFTEMHFSHLDPVKGKLPIHRLLREFGKFILAMYPMFRQSVAE